MTQRFEARPGLPQQPRIIESRLSATLSRDQLSQTTRVFESTEIFRTGPEGLFSAVRGELSRVIRYVPEVHLPSDPNQPITAVIASGNNHKAQSMLEHLPTHRISVARVPEAEEWHTRDAILDATSKAIDAADIIQTSEQDDRRAIRNRPHVTIANDQVNAIPFITRNRVNHLPVVAFERLGKPATDYPEDPKGAVREMFGHLAQLAEDNHWQSVPYLTEVATVIHNPKDPNNNAVSLQKSAIFLSAEGLKHLATDRFDEYTQNVAEQAGKANGKSDVGQLAGGFELQVLADMGIIDFISGTPSEIQTSGFPPKQRPEALQHAYSLALGTADELLIKEYFGQAVN